MTTSANPIFVQPFAISDVVSWEEGSAKFSRTGVDFDGTIRYGFTVYHNAAALPIGTVLQWSSNGYVIPTVDGSTKVWTPDAVTTGLNAPALIVLVAEVPVNASGTSVVQAITGHAVLKSDKLEYSAGFTGNASTLVANTAKVVDALAGQSIYAVNAA